MKSQKTRSWVTEKLKSLIKQARKRIFLLKTTLVYLQNIYILNVLTVGLVEYPSFLGDDN